MKARLPKARIDRVTQSPMNEQRWCLDLDCGHRIWVTAKRRPTRKQIGCNDCTRKQTALDAAGEKATVKETMIGELRVWWIPQVPMEPFYASVGTLREARLLLDTLADYDLFQIENRIKSDFSNVGGLQVFSSDAGDGEAGWIDWYDQEGRSIDELEAGELAVAMWAETKAVEELDGRLQ